MGILGDIDSVIDKADVFINVKSEREIAEILDKTIKFTSVPFDSCHYAILKKFDTNSGRTLKKKMVQQQQIGTFNWDCTNLLKYYGVDHIFKGANICIKQRVEHGWGNYEYVITKMAIIFRGHKRKDDYAILLNSISSSTAQNSGYLSVTNYIKEHTNRCVAKLRKVFTDEFYFNELFVKLRTKYHIGEFSGNKWLEF